MSSDFTLMLKLPSISETVPLRVPTTTMDAPVTGSPVVSTMVPAILLCANATCTVSIITSIITSFAPKNLIVFFIDVCFN